MVNLDNKVWPSSPLKEKNLNEEQLKQFLRIRADYEKCAFVTAGHLEVRALGAKEFTKAIEPDESGITALVKHPSGHIYGGTGGKAAHLFFYNPAPDADAAADIGIIPGAVEVVSLAVLPDDSLIGAANKEDGKSLLFIYKSCEVLLREKCFDGMGVREIFDLPAEDQLFFSTIDPCHSSGTIEVLDSPVNGKICDLICAPDGGSVYILAAGSGEIISYTLAGGAVKKIGTLDPNGNFSPRLTLDGQGRLYGAGLYGRIFRYTPETEEFRALNVNASSVKGWELYNQVTAWCSDKSGTVLYGGNNAGQIFRFDTVAEKIITLGKPCVQTRITGMSRSGKKIYAVIGETDDCAHLASYDDETRELLDLGCLLARSERPWNGYRFEAMTTGRNGELFLGEYDRISQLFIFYPSIEE
ncbi:MAG: hypothetical protein J6S43_04335 [Lentisphaeria bacterium]|nr:hypothetical protein [Lentisphaeria bacterium]